MSRHLLLALPCALALPHKPEHWTHGPVGVAASNDFYQVKSNAQFLDMPLDHFSNSSETWKFKYFVVDTYFKNGGPLVLNMPGEGATGGCYGSSLVVSLGAMAVCSEHRFFGDSVPLGLSTVENLQHLSVEQNLADQIALVKHLRATYPSISSVVSNGGSYSGASSAWIRDQYPEDIDAAIAESPPIVVRQAFPEYDISNLVALSSPDARCANTMAKINEAINRQLQTNRSALFSLFKADYQITSDTGDSDFIYGIGDVTAYKVQYGAKAEQCAALKPLYGRTDVTDVEYTQAFQQYTFSVFGEGYFSKCDYNSTCMREATHDVPAQSMRSWFWMKCVHLGYFQVAPQTGLATRPRAYTEQKAMDQCAYIFPGAKLISPESVKDFNTKFGGAAVGGTSKIFELDYSDDPWKMSTSVPLLERSNWVLDLDQPFLYHTCDGCAHCGSGVPASEKQLINEQKVSFLQSWGISVLGEQPSLLV